MFASVLHANGEVQQRYVLFEAMEARMATMDRILNSGYGDLDIHIHAMRGDRDRAIAALRDAITSKWLDACTDGEVEISM